MHSKRTGLLFRLRPLQSASAERRFPASGEMALALASAGLLAAFVFVVVRTAPATRQDDGALAALSVALALPGLSALWDVWSLARLRRGVRVGLSTWTLIVVGVAVVAARLTLAPGEAAMGGDLRHEGDRLIVPRDLGPSVVVLRGRLPAEARGSVEAEIRAGEHLISASLAKRRERAPAGARMAVITTADAKTSRALPAMRRGESVQLVRLSGLLDGGIAVQVFEQILQRWIALGAASVFLIVTGLLAGPSRLLLFASSLSIVLVTATTASIGLSPRSTMPGALGPLVIGFPLGIMAGWALTELSRRITGGGRAARARDKRVRPDRRS